MGSFNWDKNEGGFYADPFVSTGSKPMESLCTDAEFVRVKDRFSEPMTVNKEWWNSLTAAERSERGLTAIE